MTIMDIIRSKNSVTVARYMELCSTHYYATRDPFGVKGDFTTAPEISQLFGEMAGAWLLNQWQIFGSKDAVLCELGGGRGTLMKDIIRVIRKSDFYDKTLIRMIENSPVLRKTQQHNLLPLHPSISWHETLDHLPERPLFLVANEFFDALPVIQYIGNEERKVIFQENKLMFAPDGEVTSEISPLSLAILHKIASHIYKYGGAALIIDYGYESRIHKDTLQALKNHCFVSPLAFPGESDITAHIDFLALKNVAAKAGAHSFGAVRQGAFLRQLGIELRAKALCQNLQHQQKQNLLLGLKRLIAPDAMGTLFKVIAITQDSRMPAGF